MSHPWKPWTDAEITVWRRPQHYPEAARWLATIDALRAVLAETEQRAESIRLVNVSLRCDLHGALSQVEHFRTKRAALALDLARVREALGAGDPSVREQLEGVQPVNSGGREALSSLLPALVAVVRAAVKIHRAFDLDCPSPTEVTLEEWHALPPSAPPSPPRCGRWWRRRACREQSQGVPR